MCCHPTDEQLWLDQDEVSYLVGGENARVKLKDISDEDIQPGYVLSPRGALACAAVNKFEAQLAIVELLEHKSKFQAPGSVNFFQKLMRVSRVMCQVPQHPAFF